MADASVKFAVEAKASAALDAIKSLAQEVETLQKTALQTSDKLTDTADSMGEAWTQTAEDMRRASAKIKDSMDKSAGDGGLSKWSKIGNIMSGAAAAMQMIGSAVSSAASAMAEHVIAPALRLQSSRTTLGGLAGGGAAGAAASSYVIDKQQAFAASSGIDFNVLLQQTELLMRSGLNYKQAVSSVQDAWVLAGKREDFATQIIEHIGEGMVATGENLEHLLGALEGASISVRQPLADLAGVALPDLAKASTEGKLTMDQVLAVMHDLAASGPAAEAFKASTTTVASQISALTTNLEVEAAKLGEKILPVVASALEQVTDLLHVLGEQKDGVSDFVKIVEFLGKTFEAVAFTITTVAKAIIKTVESIKATLSGEKNPLTLWAELNTGAPLREAFNETWNKLQAQKIARAERDMAAEADRHITSNDFDQLKNYRKALAGPKGIDVTLPALKPTATAQAPAQAVTQAAAAVATVAAKPAAKKMQEVWEANRPSSLSRSTVSTSLAAVGGGGYRATFFEAQKVTYQKKLVAATDHLARTADDIKKTLDSSPLGAAVLL